MPLLHPDRLFPVDKSTRRIAREIYIHIKGLPIIGPHGHIDPAWLANNKPFSNPTELFITLDHYLLRMLYSQGISLQSMGIQASDNDDYEQDPRT